MRRQAVIAVLLAASLWPALVSPAVGSPLLLPRLASSDLQYRGAFLLP